MYGVEVIIRNVYKIGVEETGSVAGAGAVNGQDGLGSDAPDANGDDQDYPPLDAGQKMKLRTGLEVEKRTAPMTASSSAHRRNFCLFRIHSVLKLSGRPERSCSQGSWS